MFGYGNKLILCLIFPLGAGKMVYIKWCDVCVGSKPSNSIPHIQKGGHLHENQIRNPQGDAPEPHVASHLRRDAPICARRGRGGGGDALPDRR